MMLHLNRLIEGKSRIITNKWVIDIVTINIRIWSKIVSMT